MKYEEINTAAKSHVKDVGGNNACYDSFIHGAMFALNNIPDTFEVDDFLAEKGVSNHDVIKSTDDLPLCSLSELIIKFIHHWNNK